MTSCTGSAVMVLQAPGLYLFECGLLDRPSGGPAIHSTMRDKKSYRASSMARASASPKIPIDRAMFLTACSTDPRHRRRNAAGLAHKGGVPEAAIFSSTHHTRQAIHRGLLRRLPVGGGGGGVVA